MKLRYVIKFAILLDNKFSKMVEITQVPGLYYFENVLSDEECKQIIEDLDKKIWTPLSNSSNSRKVQHYGYLYDYKGYSVTKAPEDIPIFLEDCKNKLTILNTENTGLKEYIFNQCIVNNYEPGQAISRHIDLKTFGKVIGCYTLGSGATMRFAKGSVTKDIYVKPGSLYLMSGDARYLWTHEMISKKKDILEDGNTIERKRRISITFRNVPTV